jgi:hypothetical protein
VDAQNDIYSADEIRVAAHGCHGDFADHSQPAVEKNQRISRKF